MSNLIFMDGFQLPFQRRLSRLYNDTKTSSDFVKDSVQNAEDPDRKALHRKLRIQKDRLACWGLEWSDPNQAVEIDASLSRAGLSEVVGSIMSTIKDTLAEAEPLWQSSMHPTAGKPSPDRKVPLMQWDKGRFEDIVRDLTASIDTLYDLSRTRSSTYLQERILKAAYKPSSSSWPEDGFRPFESSRIKTPRQISPQTLTRLRPTQQGDANIPPREIVFMSQTAYSEFAQSNASEEPWVPLLLEYAVFDSIYSVTGIMPPMSRFEKLSSSLQQDPQRAPRTWTGLPRLLGYFEDLDHSRLGLIYTLPPSFKAISFEQLTNNPRYTLPTLSDVLQRQAEPPLEAKFGLAYNLVNTIFDMHARGFAHYNLVDKNVSFCDITTSTLIMQGMPLLVDIRRPLVSSFDLFPEDGSTAQGSPWRHPLDPRGTVSIADRPGDGRILDLYPLAMMLLSIGLWTKLEHLLPDPDTDPAVISTSALDQLAVKCGTLYMRAVQTCWRAVDNELSGKACNGENLLSAVQMQVSRFLETCCILDGVSGFEQRLAQELREMPPVSNFEEQSESTKNTRSSSDYPTDRKLPILPAEGHSERKLSRFTERTSSVEEHQGVHSAIGQSDGLAIRSQPLKMRLYPHVPISPDVVDKWNAILMPQVNQALRQFYRNHPESVEISLESVGPSPHETKPTVVVVCASVGKVRAILKKRLGELFDDTTGFALKVCRGHIVRSRRNFRTVPRSMAPSSSPGIRHGDDADTDGDEIEAANPQYQECPKNGASIGAWIGDRHLPPVSFGGLILVDSKPYGMTVHHMLDDPGGEIAQMEPLRSSSLGSGYDWHAELVDSGGGHDEGDAYALSDTESESYTETDITSNYGDGSEEEEEEEEETEDGFEPGDVPGIEPGCGGGYIITQPALDDVEGGFYPCAETEDEDHLDTFNLGEVYASSGIRRKQANGLTHEVDWALFTFEDGRLPDGNSIPCWDAMPAAHKAEIKSWDGHDLHKLWPTTVVPSSSLPGLEVQCMARTSGLQIGRIHAALTSVKLYGRCSPSHAYQIASIPWSDARTSMSGDVPIGIPGDSGAWVVDRRQGQLCGHVLAWSQRKRVAYICPMDVLLLDVAQTLDASEVRLPGGGELVVALEGPRLALEQAGYVAKSVQDSDEVAEDMLAGGSGEASPCYSVMKRTETGEAAATPTGSSQRTSGHGSTTPIRLETSYEPRGLATRLEDLHVGHSLRNLGQWVDSHA